MRSLAMIELRSEYVGEQAELEAKLRQDARDNPQPSQALEEAEWLSKTRYTLGYGCMVTMALAPVIAGCWLGIVYPMPDSVKLSVIGLLFVGSGFFAWRGR